MADESTVDVGSLVAQLRNENGSLRPSAIPDAPGLDQAGLYAWYANESACTTLTRVLDMSIPPLIYAGQAGANTARPSKATLRSRIGSNHCRGSIESSTFRRTLAALLRDDLDLVLERPGVLRRGDENRLSEWIADHLHVATVPVPDRDSLRDVEQSVLSVLDPPLNLQHMKATAVRAELKRRRSSLGRRQSSKAAGSPANR